MTGLLKRLGIVTTLAIATLGCRDSPTEVSKEQPDRPKQTMGLRVFHGEYEVIKKERLDENGNVEWSYDWRRKVEFTRGREVPNEGMANEYFKLDERNVTWRIGLDFDSSQERLPPFSVHSERPLSPSSGIYETYMNIKKPKQDFKIRETDQRGVYIMDMLPATFDELLRFTLEEMK
jgi:hypothetical protein